VQGGNSSGGVVVSDSGPALIPDELPDFIAKAAEPYIKRKQSEQFFKGFTAAESGRALGELDKSNSGIRSIFGSNAYEKGAQYYTAKTAVDTWQSRRLADMDNLKRMPEAEVAKLLAEEAQAMMTGNAGADMIIQQGIIEATGPLINTITKERYKFQQTETVRVQAGSYDASASALQALSVSQGNLSDPADKAEAQTAINNQTESYLASLRPIAGQAEDSWKAGFVSHVMRALDAGNGYAYQAIKRTGLLESGGVLTDDQITKLEARHARSVGKAFTSAMPALKADLLALDLSTQDEAGDPTTRIVDYAKQVAVINAKARALTGFDEDLITTEDLRTGAKSITSTLLSAYHRREARNQAVADHARDRSEKLADEAAERAAEAAEVTGAWIAGDATAGILGGMKAGSVETLARNDFLRGDVSNIARQFNSNGYVADSVKTLAQAGIKASLGQGYTKTFDASHQQWTTLMKASEGATRAYYGDQFVAMQKFDMLSKSVPPELAWARSFGDMTQFSTPVPPELRSEVRKAIPDAIDGTESYWFIPGGTAKLNESSKAFLGSALEGQVGLELNGNTDRPLEAVVGGSLKHLLSSGRIERSGSFVWGNMRGNAPLATMIGATPKEFETTFAAVVDARLKADGYADGASGDATVLRIKDQGGKAGIWVYTTDPDNYHDIFITSDELKSAKDKVAKGEVLANQPDPALGRLDPANVNGAAKVGGMHITSVIGGALGSIVEADKRLIEKTRQRALVRPKRR
jgi:hypothetical protein